MRVIASVVMAALVLLPQPAPLFPPELPPLLDPVREMRNFMWAVAEDEPRDESERMDTLVVWSACSGWSPALAQQSVDLANTSYVNSLVRGRLRLVGAELAPYTEANGGSLNWMAGTGRTWVEGRRSVYGADLVHMVTCESACGQGFLNATDLYAYSVSHRDCTISNLTFPHELGHNQGCQHDPMTYCGQPVCGGDNYGHGMGESIGRTIMAYPSAGGPRLPYFSNPDVSVGGAPTGILGQRNNARVINANAARIAGFRAPAGAQIPDAPGVPTLKP